MIGISDSLVLAILESLKWVSSVARPKIWGDFLFLANNTILFGIPPLKAQNKYVLKIWGASPRTSPPANAYEMSKE